jgi:hypothetical protein
MGHRDGREPRLASGGRSRHGESRLRRPMTDFAPSRIIESWIVRCTT